jgi:hypothetical protein
MLPNAKTYRQLPFAIISAIWLSAILFQLLRLTESALLGTQQGGEK